MILTDLIKDQVFQSAIMFSAGLGFGMLYQVWEICRKSLVHRAEAAQEARISARAAKSAQKAEKRQKDAESHKRRPPKPAKPRRPRGKADSAVRIRALSSVLEFAFWPLAAFFVWEFMYYAAYGDISFHNFLALALGALLWRKAFYDIVY